MTDETLKATSGPNRRVNYLGAIANKLGDLQGFGTLAFELIQNADDAPGATQITFDIQNDVLVVDNDGTFSECDDVTAPSCARIATDGHRCDFHRFQEIDSGDKRNEDETTGAFGIGFISVYQITDHPELLSAGRHWKLREDAPEGVKNIEVCGGCSECRGRDLPGTRFLLPWATNPDSAMRTALRVGAITPETPHRLAEEIATAAPEALMFLKKLNCIRLLRDGRPASEWRRERHDDEIVIRDSGREDRWWVLGGDFHAEGSSLRENHPRLIDPKKKTRVQIAIPLLTDVSGRLFACLPTRQETGLPFHVDADFFPKSDRKSVRFDAEDPASEWNRAAIRSVGVVLRSSLIVLRDRLGKGRFWRLLSALDAVAKQAREGGLDAAFGAIWEEVVPALPDQPIVPDTAGRWWKPAETVFAPQEALDPAAEVLSRLGLFLVDTSLRPHQNLLTGPPLGVPVISVGHVAQVIRKAGYSEEWSADAQNSGPLETDDDVRLVRDTLSALLRAMRSGPARQDAIEKASSLPLAPTVSGEYAPFNSTFRDRESASAVFSPLSSKSRFLPAACSEQSPYTDLCPLFEVANAIAILEDAGRAGLLHALDLPRSIAVLEWLSIHRKLLEEDRRAIDALRALPVVPTVRGNRTPHETAFPGGFVDPLEIADLVDPEVTVNSRPILRLLGVRELNLHEYITTHLSRSVAAEGTHNAFRDRALGLLGAKLGEFRDAAGVLDAVRRLRIVRCDDGVYRRPGDVYFPNEVSRALLPEAPVVAPDLLQSESTRELLVCLGVHERPPISTIVNAVRSWTTQGPSEESRRWIGEVVRFLHDETNATGSFPPDAEPLRELAWLPAEGRPTAWFRPRQLYAAFRRNLFGNEAPIVDLPLRVQQGSVGTLEHLGVTLSPGIDLVVRHLTRSAEANRRVSSVVYQFLSDNSEHSAIEQLLGRRCLDVGSEDGPPRYVGPREVFWYDSSFVPLRLRLRSDLGRIRPLLDRLGVRDAPDFTDALAVLQDLQLHTVGEDALRCDQIARIAATAWALLSRHVESGEIQRDDLEILQTARCVVASDDTLFCPQDVFTEDRPGLALLFPDAIRRRVIRRDAATFRALEAAGARRISDAARVHVDDESSARQSDDFKRLLQERLPALLRLGVSTTDGQSVAESVSSLKVFEHDTLTVHWTIKADGQTFSSEAQESEAAFDWRKFALFHRPEARGARSAALGRELAAALWPDDDPSERALAVRDILSSPSLKEAQDLLDTVGMPTPTVIATQTDEERGEVGTLGSADVDSAQGDRTETISAADSQTSVPSGTSTEGADVTHARSRSNGERNQLIRYSVYVATGRPSREEPPERVDQRGQIDRAAVQAVLSYEKGMGRHPQEMDHQHPGFDIESYDDEGIVVRFIEVKGLAADWDMRGVGLSGKQFAEAQASKEKYWLYVVENAVSDHSTIHRIQNPGGRANRFFFDRSWDQVTEQTVEDLKP